jgi:hypothetical protein
MRKYIWLPLILLAVIGCAAVDSKAQSPLGLRADVPFDFMVADTILEAGTITTRGVTASESGPLSITSLSGSQNVRRIAHRMTIANTQSEAKLVFRRYGNRYYLAQVWVPGYKPWEVEKSQSELALERETRFAKNSRPRRVVVIAVTQ